MKKLVKTSRKVAAKADCFSDRERTLKMAKDMGTIIFNDLIIIKTRELEECNKEITNGHHSSIVRKALFTYKHELLENLEMYDRYLNINAWKES